MKQHYQLILLMLLITISSCSTKYYISKNCNEKSKLTHTNHLGKQKRSYFLSDVISYSKVNTPDEIESVRLQMREKFDALCSNPPCLDPCTVGSWDPFGYQYIINDLIKTHRIESYTIESNSGSFGKIIKRNKFPYSKVIKMSNDEVKSLTGNFNIIVKAMNKKSKSIETYSVPGSVD